MAQTGGSGRCAVLAQSVQDQELDGFLRIQSAACDVASAASRRSPVGGSGDMQRWPQPERDFLVQQAQQAAEATFHRLAQMPTVSALPPRPDAACMDRRWQHLFTGQRRPQSQTVVDVLSGFKGGSDTGLLEVRLHEYSGLAQTVVGESWHNEHGDWKNLTFPAFASTLFKQFVTSGSVEHVVVDEGIAPACMQRQRLLRNARDRRVRQSAQNAEQGLLQQNEGEQAFELELQGLQRTCLWQEYAARHPELPGDAIVIFSDVDVFPAVDFVTALKYCELRPAVLESTPINLESNSVAFNLRTARSTGCGKHDWQQGSISLLSNIPAGGPALHYANGVAVQGGGVHLSTFGSLTQVMYHSISHTTSGEGLPGVQALTQALSRTLPPSGGNALVRLGNGVVNGVDAASSKAAVDGTESLGACRTMRNDGEWLAARLADDPQWVWQGPSAPLPAGPPDFTELARCGIPRFLQLNPCRYPSFFGYRAAA